MCLIRLELKKEKQLITFIDAEHILDLIQEIHEMLSKIDSKEIVSIVHNDVLNDLQFLFLNINNYNTMVKSLRYQIRLKSQTENKEIFPNPLNTISFNFDVQIKTLSRILTYLQEGYKKDFPENGGIEECAQYTYYNNPVEPNKKPQEDF